ncbi:hypothetical protein E1292_21010 [Nonomuraea deserti]|uniref:Uncharacterized protein n=1 Tax=Nonomuraea deserti TaxID=1848322 RepID=A0A4R4VI78_9ACTN|nr:hypothetical protein [Nonomuraea deserti]TDD03477.1 hypothetical protein E1292_21010 [Nonomuraea deserti]
MAVKVNHVWFGDNPLGTLDKFNVYTWRALGHEVTIYAHRWNGTPHDEASLGLSGSGVKVENLSTILAEDDNKRTETLPETRALLKGWIEATNKEKPLETDFIYNMVDLTKSYIGGTCQGIVLDLKVGPSPHLAAYEEVFKQKFVSYTRGGNTPGDRPENQCIGTMEEADTLRSMYATAFDGRIKDNLDGQRGLRTKPAEKHFNTITSIHGNGFEAATPNIDVATKTPKGDDVGNQYVVGEIRQQGHGPFRVFKAADDQTNKSGVKTKPVEIVVLCQQVWDDELKDQQVPNPQFLAKVAEALKALPEYKAPAVASACPDCGKPVKPIARAAHKLECKGTK